MSYEAEKEALYQYLKRDRERKKQAQIREERRADAEYLEYRREKDLRMTREQLHCRRK